MRKLVMLAILAAGIATLSAIPAGANAPHSNGRIAFVRFDPVLHDDFVYTANPDGSHEQQLLPTGAEGPHWSPDGTLIAVFPHDVDNVSARIVNPDNGSYRDIANPDPDRFFLPCNGPWSPDGQRLTCSAFSDDGSLSGIYTLRSSDGGGLERVTANPGGEDCPGDYSPNGKRLVFLRRDENGLTLYTVKLDGTGLRRLTPTGMNLSFDCGNWSPQGNEILFSAVAGARRSIFVVHADGSELQQIPIATCGDTTGCFQPVWSPDGQKIVFTRFLPQTGQSDIYTVKADGTGLSPAVTTPLGEDGPDWGTHPLTP
jgi:Tol biopolymer transport system component